jgi:hypothetical protein
MLLMGFLVVLSLVKAPASLSFVTAAIAFGGVVVDVVLAVKFNMPINAQFRAYPVTMPG